MTDPQDILKRAATAYAEGRFADAARGFEEVIQAHPEVGELHINLGAALRAAGEPMRAEAAYRNAIRLAPENALAWFNLGNLLSALKQPDEALAAFRKADRLQPDTPEIINNTGVQLYELGHVEESIDYYDAALELKPDFADALTNRGNALQRMCRMEEARRDLEAALVAAPGNPVYLLNMSAYMAATGHHDDALQWADRALDADPGYTLAKLKRASLLIQQGDLVDGHRAYEARWDIPAWHPLPARLKMPAWQGENITGKSLLLWNEQGYGDALMYARYIPLLANAGACPVLMCERPLMRLMQQSFGDDVEVVDLADTPPDADFHLSIMSLPHLLGTTLESIPADVPYLAADTSETDAWQQTLNAQSDDGPAVGLVWAGNPGQAHDYSRSMAPADILPLLDIGHVRFVNLLIGPRGDEIADARLYDPRCDLGDFAATAAMMSALDLVVSVDSAPAHLAGALGRPLWIALAFDPDSRYFLNRDDSPWYPEARLFRQSAPGDWTGVVDDLGKALNLQFPAKAES